MHKYNRTILLPSLIIVLSIIEYCYQPVRFLTIATYNHLCTPKIPVDKVYVINLDRSPDRLVHIKQELKKLKIPFSRFRAIDYKELTLTNIHTNQIFKHKDFENNWQFFIKHPGTYNVVSENQKNSSFQLKTKLTNEDIKNTMDFIFNPKVIPKVFIISELGCIYSHRSVMENIVENHYKGSLVFEDDVIFYQWFREQLVEVLSNIPPNTDVIYFGWHHLNPEAKLTSSKNPHLIKINGMFYGMYAYYITEQGAKKILQNTKIMEYAIDTSIAYLSTQNKLNLYIVKDQALRPAKNIEFQSTRLIMDKIDVNKELSNFQDI